MTSRFLGSADRALIEDRLLRLVLINSVNPGIDGGPDESDLAIEIEGLLRALSLRTQRQAVAGHGRDNIVGRLQGAGKAPVVLFEAHLDTVGLSGTATTEARSEGGVVYGRGACDAKGSIVAMLETLRLLEGTDVSLRPTVVFVGTIDEEYAGTGAATLVGKPTDFDMAIVGEPTELHRRDRPQRRVEVRDCSPRRPGPLVQAASRSQRDHRHGSGPHENPGGLLADP